MSSIMPTEVTRRSQLSRRHIELGAEFERSGELLLVKDYGSQTEATQAQILGLVDLSTLQRTGFKGAGAYEFNPVTLFF